MQYIGGEAPDAAYDNGAADTRDAKTTAAEYRRCSTHVSPFGQVSSHAMSVARVDVRRRLTSPAVVRGPRGVRFKAQQRNDAVARGRPAGRRAKSRKPSPHTRARNETTGRSAVMKRKKKRKRKRENREEKSTYSAARDFSNQRQTSERVRGRLPTEAARCPLPTTLPPPR